jgi:hypothetical protein
MKNKILALVLITIVLASCTKDDIKPTIAMAGMDVSIKTDGSLNSMTVTTTSTDYNYSTSQSFNLVDGESKLHLDKVPVGHNKVEITTTSTAKESEEGDISDDDVTTILNKLKDKKPYATYCTTINNCTVVEDKENDLEPTLLKTQHGRSISIFQLSDQLKALGVSAVITAILDGSPSGKIKLTLVGNTTCNGYYYWSDKNSTNGKTISFIVDLFDKNNHKFNSLIITPFPITCSSSIDNIYTINENDIITNTTNEKFTAQPWINQDNHITIGN